MWEVGRLPARRLGLVVDFAVFPVDGGVAVRLGDLGREHHQEVMQHLVETLAASMWKLRRAHRIAAGDWEYPGWQRDTRRSVPVGPKGNRELGHYNHGDREHLDRHEAHLHRVIDRSLRQLRQLQAGRPSTPPEPVTAVSNPIPLPIQQDTAAPQDPLPVLVMTPDPPEPPYEG